MSFTMNLYYPRNKSLFNFEMRNRMKIVEQFKVFLKIATYLILQS